MPDEKLTAYRGGKALRRGWTTGSCAAAASQAAAVLLLTGIAPPEIHLHTRAASPSACRSRTHI